MLLCVLLIIVILTLIAVQYHELMVAEHRAAENVHRVAQSRAFAESGIHYVMAMLSSRANVEQGLGGNIYDNPLFHAQIVQQDAQPHWRGLFTVIAPLLQSDGTPGQGYRFGVIEESSKINLNAMIKLDPTGQKLYDMLVKLPGMDEGTAARIVDWLDPDADVRPGGSESSPFRVKNGPIDSLDELLLIEGVTPELLYGGDLNRNGVLDPDEPQLDPVMALGWSAYLTIYSREQNITSDLKLRINLNESDMAALHSKLLTALGTELANYIVLYRQYGGQQLAQDGSGNTSGSAGTGSSTGASGSGGQATRTTTTSTKSSGASGSKSKSGSASKSGSTQTSGSTTPAPVAGNLSQVPQDVLKLNSKARRRVRSLLELINSQVTVPGKKAEDPATIYLSPLNDPAKQERLLPLLFDQATTRKDAEIPARININTAPPAVLATLPLTETEVADIIQARPDVASIPTASAVYRTPAWVLTQAKLPLQTARRLEPYITTYSQVYRVQVIGYYESGSTFTRLEAVIDANAGKPRILMVRDLSNLGKGFDIAGN